MDSTAEDVVYTNFFTGVHGNYLRGSIESVGLDPDDLPTSDPSAMSFRDDDRSPYQAWRDVWGAGQGIGAVTTQPSVAELVATLRHQYDEAAAGVLEILRRRA
jgi:nitronate monooxygenase